MTFSRVALFIDYENFYATLRRQHSVAPGAYGHVRDLDFEALVEVVTATYGPLRRDDFVVVANFTHFNPQKGGLSRMAQVIDVDSFEARSVRQVQQSSPGKKHVMRDYADMRLAFEIGQHAAHNPAPLYILCSGDKGFTAVGRALKAQGCEVLFLIPDPRRAAQLILDEFKWVAYNDLIALKKRAAPAPEPEARPRTTSEPVDVLVNVITRVRETFSTPVPVCLIQALAGPRQAESLLNRAYGQGRVDLWTSPDGVACISRREERLFGKVVEQETRPAFVQRADMLLVVAEIGEAGLPDVSRAGWRRALKSRGGLSSKAAKRLLAQLLALGILREGELHKPKITVDAAIEFLMDG